MFIHTCTCNRLIWVTKDAVKPQVRWSPLLSPDIRKKDVRDTSLLLHSILQGDDKFCNKPTVPLRCKLTWAWSTCKWLEWYKHSARTILVHVRTRTRAHTNTHALKLTHANALKDTRAAAINIIRNSEWPTELH